MCNTRSPHTPFSLIVISMQCNAAPFAQFVVRGTLFVSFISKYKWNMQFFPQPYFLRTLDFLECYEYTCSFAVHDKHLVYFYSRLITLWLKQFEFETCMFFGMVFVQCEVSENVLFIA